MEAIGRREGVVGKGAVSLGWVDSHIGIRGNMRADEMTNKGAEKRVDVLQLMEGGIQQKIKRWRKEARQVEGFGKGTVKKAPFRRGASRSEMQKAPNADRAEKRQKLETT